MQVLVPSASDWDAFVRAHPRGHLLQLSAWATLKNAFGWQAARVALADSSGLVAGAQILFRPLPLRLGAMAYVPFGGYVADDSLWPALWQAVHAAAKQHKARFLKLEPGFDLPQAQPLLISAGFRAAAQTIQPPSTIMIALADDETMLARMNQGTRRKIRQSHKNGVTVTQASSAADVAQFSQLMQITSARNAFGVHEPAYYALAYELFVPNDAALMLAWHEGELLAGVFVFAVGSTACYLYGASSDHKRSLMPSYAAQWAAIQWARDRGCATYDMWGIPDAPLATLEAEFETRTEGLWGVYGFKRGWGGQVVRSAGAWDYAYSPLLYRAYLAALRLR
jgi:lipid II:glycine glycyltransferase (peptidoglycan interpeptide bridge formation enzyme)